MELEKKYPKGTTVYFKPGPMYDEKSGVVHGYSTDEYNEMGLDIKVDDEKIWGYWRKGDEVSLTPQSGIAQPEAIQGGVHSAEARR